MTPETWKAISETAFPILAWIAFGLWFAKIGWPSFIKMMGEQQDKFCEQLDKERDYSQRNINRFFSVNKSEHDEIKEVVKETGEQIIGEVRRAK